VELSAARQRVQVLVDDKMGMRVKFHLKLWFDAATSGESFFCAMWLRGRLAAVAFVVKAAAEPPHSKGSRRSII
jgi:hypothetical protein